MHDNDAGLRLPGHGCVPIGTGAPPNLPEFIIEWNNRPAVKMSDFPEFVHIWPPQELHTPEYFDVPPPPPIAPRLSHGTSMRLLGATLRGFKEGKRGRR